MEWLPRSGLVLQSVILNIFKSDNYCKVKEIILTVQFQIFIFFFLKSTFLNFQFYAKL